MVSTKEPRDMRRNPRTGLVSNEQLVLVALLELGKGSIHPYALTKHWKQNPNARSLPYATLYRCLHKLEELSLVTSRSTEHESEGPARREYKLTGEGQAIAIDCSKTIDERLSLPNAPGAHA